MIVVGRGERLVNGGTLMADSAKLILKANSERNEKEHEQKQQRRQDDQPFAVPGDAQLRRRSIAARLSADGLIAVPPP